MLFGQDHVKRYVETDGEEGHDWQGTTTLILTTTGRRTGEQRSTPLIYQAEGDAFLVVDSSLLVQAMSREAQTLLAMSEEMAVDKPVAELLVPADAEAGRTGFAAAVAQAADGQDPDTARAVVRPWNTFGVRMRARIATCGPPRQVHLPSCP